MSTNMPPAITIAYEGESTLPQAARLRELLSSATNVSPVEDVTPEGGELGIGTLLISIVARSLAKATAKTVIARFRAFLQERIQASDHSLRLQVDVNGSRKQSLAFSLERATLETADDFCARLENIIEALL